MSPWTPYTQENVNKIQEGLLGVFQLSRGEANIAYVGRADEDLRRSLLEHLNQGYTHFQWVQLPWTKETFEMQCRLYHHGGGRRRLDNVDHPFPPEGKNWMCPVSASTPAMCEM
jgi:hypothetical protein